MVFTARNEVAKIVLITSHSNAGIEWVHSLVNTKSEGLDRNCLDIEGLLSSIYLSHKTRMT